MQYVFCVLATIPLTLSTKPPLIYCILECCQEFNKSYYYIFPLSPF